MFISADALETLDACKTCFLLFAQRQSENTLMIKCFLRRKHTEQYIIFEKSELSLYTDI